MSSRLRTVLILAAVAAAGLAALGTMAERYRRMAPERSVLDLPRQGSPPPAAAPAETFTPAEVPPVPEAPVADAPEATEVGAPDETTPTESDLAAVRRFLEVRAAMLRYIEEHPRVAEALVEWIEEGAIPTEAHRANPRFMMGLRAVRHDELLRLGMSEDEYRVVRDSFTAWKEGTGIDRPAKAFEAVGETARRADLGPLEPVDYGMAF